MITSQRARAIGRSSRGLLLVALALCCAVAARADVTIKEKTVSNGLGGFGSTNSERTTVIAGDKSRSDESSTYTGRFQTFAGGGKPRASASITRLDKELLWQLDPTKQTYTEMTFAEMREMMAKGMSDAQQEMNRPENKRAKDVEMDYKVDVQRTGKKDKVNGYAAEEWILSLTATAKDQADKKAQSFGYTMKMDMWMADNVPGSAEARAFGQKFAEKMGMDPQVSHMMAGMMGQYRDGLKQLAEKMKDMHGYPVRNTVSIDMGGSQAQLTPEQQEKLARSQADADQARKQQADQQAGDNAAGDAAQGNLAGALGGMFGHKLAKGAQKDNGSQNPGAAPGGAPGSMFSVTTDVISITTGPASASFDVPSDYKKVERRQR